MPVNTGTSEHLAENRTFTLKLIILLKKPKIIQSLSEVSLQLIESEHIYDKAPFPSCHASTIVETKDGLLAAWFGGTQEMNPDVCIYSSRYSNSKWSDPVLVADGVISESLRYPCWNPVLYRLNNGTIVLFYKVGPSPEGWWGEYKLSSDDGITWGERIALPEGILGPIKNKPVTLPNGKILYGTSVEYSGVNWKAFIESSEQDLTSWRKITIDNGVYNAIQPTFFFFNGKLEIYCRTQEGTIARAKSDDWGDTWTKLEGTTLQNNNSGIDGIALKNGLRLLVCNPQQKGRNKLVVMGSIDGNQWETMFTLEDQPSGEYSYPAIICRNNGIVDITYTYKRDNKTC